MQIRKILAIAFLCGLLIGAASVVEARRTTDRPATGRLDDADPEAATDIIMHDIGNVRFTIGNYGEAGNPNAVPGFKGFEFPFNSGNDFLFSAGVWVGADVNGVRLVSTGTDGDNGTGEFYPVHLGAIPFSNNSLNPDWHITSKTLNTFGDRYFGYGAKDIDDDGDWTDADDLDGDGKASKNWDGGKGLIDFDDDADELIDEEIANGEDDDGDGDIDEDTDATGDVNGDGNCNYDPEAHIDEDPAGDMARDYVDNDNDGLVDAEDSDSDGDCCPGFLDDDGDGLEDEDGVARGVQEYYAVMQDDIEPQYVSSPDVDGHTPLGIILTQRTYAFPEDYAADFILLDYRIRNVSPLALRNVYIAMFSDPDIGAQGEGGDPASLDDFNYYDPDRLMAVSYDDIADADGAGPGVFAYRVVKTPVDLDQLRVTFANFDRVSGGDPETNVDKFNMISSGDVSPATPAMGDWRMLLSFGADATNGFTIRPGETLPITLAFIAGSDTADIGKNAEWARAMFLNDFQGPSSPDVPEYFVDVYPDMVRLRWKPNAEASVDAITGLADFEGYTVERKTGQTEWQRLAVFDQIDTLEIPFEWENFNLGMPDTIRYNDSTFEYFLVDSNLIPGQTYEYVVRAFDQGVLGAGILYSGRTGNTQTVTIAVQGGGGQTAGKLSDVYVYPNPYKGSHSGEQLPVFSGGQNLFVRQLYFRGLPTEGKSTIRIYSLGGDYLNKIEHDGSSEQTRWDLLTRNGQEIASGIYYYTVEHGSDMFVDKFVVIK